MHPALRRTRALLLTLIALLPLASPAQQKPNIAGTYNGMLGNLHLRLHLTSEASGAFTGALDSLDQNAIGLPCADIHIDGQSLTFNVPAVNGSWKGTVSPDGASLSGTWSQGASLPLNFTRDNSAAAEKPFVPASKPSRVDGIWLGALQIPTGPALRIQLHVRSDSDGNEYCTSDSLDQNAAGLPCTNVAFKGNDFSFDVPVVHGHWAGTLSVDGNTLTGTWFQNNSLPLNLTRQATAIAVTPPPPPTFDPAIPPVDIAQLQSVLDKDLAEALKSGELAPSTGAGVAIAVEQHGVRRIFTYGTASPDSIFEIGSITKTFTGLILAQMVEQKSVQLDEPVRNLLPPGTVAKPSGDEITLLDLATQHSGLPRMPDNFTPTDQSNPYADYRADNLYAFLKKQTVARPANRAFLYSNLGFGLLGQALAVRAGLSYPALLKQQITDPLGLKDTVINLSSEQLARFIPGHSGDHQPAHAWDLDAFAGAGGIRSTARDMLTYLDANLHPEKLKPAAGLPAAATLSAAITQSHQLRGDFAPGMSIGLAWLYETETGNYWHNGATGGYSAFAFFNPKGDYAAVVLLNTTIGKTGSYADRIGQHISQRLSGKPAISLAN